MASNEARSKVSQKVVEEIINMIREGGLKVGDRLPSERAMTEKLGISRASLREALAALEIIGILEVRHGEGSFISEFNLSPFVTTISPLLLRTDRMEEDLLDFRRLIEQEGLNLIMNRTFRDTTTLRRHLAEMRTALDENDLEANVQADIAFHRQIMHMSGNYILVQAAECVQYLFAQSIKFNVAKILEKGDNAEFLYEQHRQICQFIEEGHRQDALNLLTSHIDFVKTI